jgi:hypothetical protein
MHSQSKTNRDNAVAKFSDNIIAPVESHRSYDVLTVFFPSP